MDEENSTNEGSSKKIDNADSLRESLIKLMIGDDLRIKVQFMDERCVLNLTRPVNFKSLEQYFQNKYRQILNIYYTASSKELMIQIKNQEELDATIQLYDKTGSKKRMRLILSQRRNVPFNNSLNSLTPLSIYRDESTLSEKFSTVSSTNRPENEKNDTSLLETQRPTSWREGRCLGRGAFGHVFVCLNTDTGEQLVVKKIYIRGNNRFRNRILASLENEVNLLGTLSHPHIVQYFGMQETSDCVNIFMELMTGGSLRDQIIDYGALSEANTIHFTVQILMGLAYLHTKDIVHRDIKPANILRHSKAHVKIGDFGSAKCLQAICSDQGIDIIGTPHYNAPEIVRDSRKFDHRSDIWSTAITVIEMLTERTPWTNIDANAVHLKIAFSEPEYLLPPCTSSSLTAVIARMLSIMPQNRPIADELLRISPFYEYNTIKTAKIP